MSETIINALDRLIPTVSLTCLCSSYQDIPHHKLLACDYAITWVIIECNTPTGVTYRDVNSEMVRVWEAEGINWPQRAIINLKVASRELWTHRKLRQDGTTIVAIMNHDDRFGSSRIFLSDYLHEHFPNGYYVAIPDRSIGIVAPSNLTLKERQDTQDLIQSCYNTASTPISPHLFAASDLIFQADARGLGC
jgi:hypothetical protein